jgi:hypothetical protein
VSPLRCGYPIGAIVLVGAVIISSCRWPGSPHTLGPDDYAVYAATVHEFFHDGDHMRQRGLRVAVGGSTRDGPPLSEGEIRAWGSTPESTAALREANNDYRARLGRHMPIQRFAGLPDDWLLIPWTEIDSAYSAPRDTTRSRWFRLRYPDVSPFSYTGFSVVGFSKDRRHALLFLGGFRHFLFFAKQGQEWRFLGHPGSRILD